MLGNLLDNAFKWAATRVEVSAVTSGDKLVVVIEDDGGGLAPTAREAVFARGVRADERTPGSGLGLAIARDPASAWRSRAIWPCCTGAMLPSAIP